MSKVHGSNVIVGGSYIGLEFAQMMRRPLECAPARMPGTKWRRLKGAWQPRLFTTTTTWIQSLNIEPEGHSAPESRDDGRPPDDVPLSDAELVQLRIRVIALENLVVALLAEASDRQLTLARDMATYISPRDGFTPHPITLRAADEMLSLVDRAGRYGRP